MYVSLLSLLGGGSVNTFPRQQIQAATEELLDACACLCIPPTVTKKQLGKEVPSAKRNLRRLRFLWGKCNVKEKRTISPSRTFFFIQFNFALRIETT
jgi:hypothetical protein